MSVAFCDSTALAFEHRWMKKYPLMKNVNGDEISGDIAEDKE